jgi:hypothetical protein
MSKDMTWEELCKKAKELDCDEFYDFIEGEYLRFFKDGEVLLLDLERDIFVQVAKNRTPDQMYQIMEALR